MSKERPSTNGPMPDYKLACPACSFQTTVSADWREALDMADDHAEGCQHLRPETVVTLERVGD